MYRRSLSADQPREVAHPLQVVVGRQSEVGLGGVVEQLHHHQVFVGLELGLQFPHFLDGDEHGRLGFEAAVGVEPVSLDEHVPLLPGSDDLRLLVELVEGQHVLHLLARVLHRRGLPLQLVELHLLRLQLHPQDAHENLNRFVPCRLFLVVVGDGELLVHERDFDLPLAGLFALTEEQVDADDLAERKGALVDDELALQEDKLRVDVQLLQL